MSDSTIPKFMKTADGFCYVYTDAISKLKHLTPYDGEIDARGMAVEAKETPVKKDAPARPRGKKQAEPESSANYEPGDIVFEVQENVEAEFSGDMIAATAEG